jgi:hypothetical protein
MKKNKSSISKASHYEEMGEFWDENSLGDHWDKTKAANFMVRLESELNYFPIEKNLSNQIYNFARQSGVSADILINMWIQQRMDKEKKQLTPR